MLEIREELRELTQNMDMLTNKVARLTKKLESKMGMRDNNGNGGYNQRSNGGYNERNNGEGFQGQNGGGYVPSENSGMDPMGTGRYVRY